MTWRRSAASWDCGSVAAGAEAQRAESSDVEFARSRAASCADRRATTPRSFQVLIGQVGKDREINAVLGKALRVLGHAELFEPVRNLLHCGPSHEDEGVREFIR